MSKNDSQIVISKKTLIVILIVFLLLVAGAVTVALHWNTWFGSAPDGPASSQTGGLDIDPDADDFVAPGNMPKRVQEFCKRTGQYVPQTMGEILRCIYQSLAFKYRYSTEMLEKLTGHALPVIHMIGGGIKDGLLCSMAADYCGKTVKAGPVEATVTGNAAIQLMSFGVFKDLNEARKVIADSFEIKTYNADTTLDLEKPYAEFLKYIGK